MTTSKRDLAYGRQGGRIVEWKQPEEDAAAAPCSVCGGPLLGGQVDHHTVCAPLPVEAPADDLFSSGA